VLRWALAATGVLLLGLVAFALWLVGTEAGLRQTVAWLHRAAGDTVRIEAAQGRLAGPLTIQRLALRTDTLHLDAEAIALDWSPAALLGARLSIDALSVERIRLASAPGDGGPAMAPGDIPLPLTVAVQQLRLGALVLADFPLAAEGGQVVLAPLEARLSADAEAIRIERLVARTPWGGGEGALTLGTRAPLSIAGALRLDTALAGPPVSAAVTLGGVLEAIALQARAEGADARIDADGLITPFEPLPLRSLTLAGEGIDPARWSPGAPAAALSLQAQLTLAGDALAGPVRIRNATPGPLDAGRLPVVDLGAQLHARLDALALSELRLQVGASGLLSGSGQWRAGAPLSAQLQLTRVDLQALDTRLPASALDGPVTLSADAAGQQLRAELKDAGIEARLVVQHADQRLTLEQVQLRRGRAEANARGALTLTETMPFELELSTRALDPKAFWAEAPAGRIDARISARGAFTTPSAQGSYRLAPSRLAGQPLSGEGRFSWSGERLDALDARLALGDNRLSAKGAWGGTRDVLSLDLDAGALAQLDLGVAGVLRLRGQLGGGLARPSGELSGEASALRLPGGVRIGRAELAAALPAGIDGEFRLALDARALVLGETPVERAELNAQGRRGAHQIEARVATGQDTARLALRGGLSDALAWQGQLTALVVEGRYPAMLVAPVDLSLAADRVEAGAGRVTLGRGGEAVFEPTRWSPGRLATRGRLSGIGLGLQTQPDARPKRGSGDLVLGGEWDLDFDREARGTVRIFREAGDLILVGDTVVRFGLERLALLATVDGGRLALSVDAAGSSLGVLTGSATAQLARVDGVWQLDASAPLLGSADLDIPSIAWLGSVASPVVRTDGRLKAEFSLSGTPAQPVGSGRIQGEALVIDIPTEGLRLGGGTLDARFDADMLEIARLDFVSPSSIAPRDGRVPYAALTRTPGTLSASGRLRLADGEGGLDIVADRLPLFQRPDRWLAISGKGRMDTRWDAPRIEASMTADGGYLEFARSPAPSLSSDVKVLDDASDAPAEPARQLKARVAIDLGRQLYLSALGLDTRLTGQLLLVADSGEPLRATGTLETLGGTYEGYGQKLVIERGLVNFQGPLDNPGLNVVALRKGLEVEAGVAITGTVRRPSVQLVSSPDVPDAAKLSWIVLGRAPEGGSGGDLAALIPAAQALLGGPGGGISSQLAAGLGLDQFSIGQGELNSASRVSTSAVVGTGSASRGASVSGQVLAVGKRLSADTTLSFEQSLSGVEHVVKLTHQLSRRLALIGRAGTDNSVDLRWSLSFR
jgi:translocation and assembly module TamB